MLAIAAWDKRTSRPAQGGRVRKTTSAAAGPCTSQVAGPSLSNRWEQETGDNVRALVSNLLHGEEERTSKLGGIGVSGVI